MPRYRSDTPAARLRDAPARARRRTRWTLRLAAGGYLAVCVAAVLGLAVTAPGAQLARPGSALAGPGAHAARAGATSGTPDGRVEDTARRVSPVPPGWARLRPVLDAAVDDARRSGHELSACVLAIDAPDERAVCAGGDEPLYAASVIKLTLAVAALESWGGDPDADTPYGPLGELVTQALSLSDNEAANLLYDLAVEGPGAPDTDDPLEAVNAVTDRVGLAEEFHTGGAFRWEWTGDMSTVTARGSVGYLAELVRAADGRAPRGRALTSPAVARIVLGAMADQDRTWKLPALLPAGSTANKTGETDTESHDVAVINTTTGRYAVAVVATAAGPYDTPDQVIAGMGRDVARALGGAVPF